MTKYKSKRWLNQQETNDKRGEKEILKNIFLFWGKRKLFQPINLHEKVAID